MASSCGPFYIFILLLLWGFQTCHARIFSFQMHHRFSDPVKKWSQKAGKGFPAGDWPEKGTVEYYAVLAHRDKILRGRGLSDVDSPITFSEGNSTFRISALGFLHYTTVSLGTPGVKFLVALDTGSDLFWVPCDCSRCAPTEGTTYGSDFQLGIYNPTGSTTSKKVTCDNSLCAHRNRCLGTFGSCPYVVSYVSAETSTSGILVEDVLHLITEDNHPEYVEAHITFGCGQVQTGSFLDAAAPNGLFGLGMEKISVPSILSRDGYTADSFSMCFGRDGVGRISFGDKGSPDQEETPFNLNTLHPSYNITVTQIRVGTTLIDLDFTALFDSGTSFTYLVDPLYARFSESFHSQAQDRRRAPDPRIPFEYCYDMSPDANTSLIPSLSFTMKGGSQFLVFDPIIVVSSQGDVAYCLAVVKSAELNIIGHMLWQNKGEEPLLATGHLKYILACDVDTNLIANFLRTMAIDIVMQENFMTGYQVIFDREKLVLGWKTFDCYDVEEPNILSITPHNSASVPPAVAVGVDNRTIPKSTKEGGNYFRNSNASPPHHCHRCNLTDFCFTLFLLLLLL